MAKSFLIVDDHPLFAEALSTICAAHFGRSTNCLVSNLAQAGKALSDHRFDVILLDLCLPGITGLEGLVELHKTAPRLPIVVISMLDDPRVVSVALQLGASGYIHKSTERSALVEAIGEVMNGGLSLPPGYTVPAVDWTMQELIKAIRQLTLTQFRVLRLLRNGKLNKEIAHYLNITESTAKAHVSQVLHTLNVHSRTQAVIDWTRLDIDRLAPGVLTFNE